MDSAHEIVVEWEGTAGEGSLKTDPVKVDTVGEKEILIDNRVVAFNLGKQVKVRYGIIVGGAEPQWSKVFPLNVLTIPDESSDWPTPTVPQAPDHKVLDLSRFEGDAAVMCIAWPLIRAGQRVWLRGYGTKADDSSVYPIVLVNGVAITETEANLGLNKVLLREELAKLKNDTELRIELRVAFDGSTNEATAVKLAQLPLSFKDGEMLSEDFDAQSDVVIQPSGVVNLRSMKITNLSKLGNARITRSHKSFPGKVERQALNIENAVAVIQLDLNTFCSQVSFWYTNVRTGHMKAVFYGENAKWLGERYLTQYGSDHASQITFSANGIVRIELVNGGAEIVWFDNFSFVK